jgi:capsular polysaccharide transport system permease protein
MSQNKLSELEKHYEIFYNALSPEQQHSPAFLIQKAEELESVDLPLAYRIMQRVKGLVSDDSIDHRLEELRAKMNSKHSDYMRASSEETPLSEMYIKPLTEKLKRQTSSIKKSKLILKLRSTLGLILVPLFLFSFYQIIWVSERYESQAGLIVKEPDNTSTLDPSMALLTGLGANSSNTDTELIKAFIHSNDMLLFLEMQLGINEHFSDTYIDYFSRLEKNASAESRLAYYIDKVNVEIDDKSGVIRVFSQAFSPEFAQKITQQIINRAEWFINEISHELGKKQLVFVQKEHALTEQRLQKAKARLLTFQRKYNLLDPEAEGLAVQEVTYGLEAKIAMKQAELSTLQSSMSKTAPSVMSAKSELISLRAQLEMQRSKLTRGLLSASTDNENTNDSVGEMLSKFTDYKIDMEFALQAYSASKVSLEKSRIETYRQIKYLMVLEAPMLPQETKYPDFIYNISLFLVLQLMLIGILKILLATVEELKQ